MTKIEINDKTYNLPTSFDEMPLKEYCRVFHNLRTFGDGEDESVMLLNAKVNESVILSRLLGEDDEFAMDLPLATFNKLADITSFIYDPSVFYDKKQFSIKLSDGKRYFIPQVREMSLRQYIDAEEVMKEDGYGQYINLLGVLLTRRDVNGKWVAYNGDYQSKAEDIGNLKCSEALPMVYSFFRVWALSSKNSMDYSQVKEVSPQVQPTQDS